ncbi:nucleolar complex protein 14 [Lobulomyces angularis]|nr:nucleolar complex protein 14 [Lobulomyces angularis]
MTKSGASALKKLKLKREQRNSGKSATKSINPFELKFTNKKHDVLNRKVKGARGNPGVTRKKSLDSRKTNLLRDLQEKSKDNTFIDRRFGENDPTMSLEDKMMARFVQEKKNRSGKGSLFNLEDDDDNEGLTHFGQSLSNMDEMDEAIFNKISHLDEDEDGQLDKYTVSKAHFGGFGDEDDPDRKKSKNEIMKEIIAKSKFHKAERQKMKDENEGLREALDADLELVRGLLSQKKSKDTEKKENSDYDLMVKELFFDKRAKPSDRSKSELEIAIEEKRRLEMLETERLERMKGPVITKNSIKRMPQGDDLDALEETVENDEVLQYDDNGVLVAGTFHLSEKRKSSVGRTDLSGEEESEDDTTGDNSSIEDGLDDFSENEKNSDADDTDIFEDANEEFCEDSFYVDAVEGEIKNINTGNLLDASVDTINAADNNLPSFENKDIPFVFKAPENYLELLTLFGSNDSKCIDIILQRLRTLYNSKLAQSNKEKLSTLLKLLLHHLRVLADKTTEVSQDFDFPIEMINVLLKHIHPLTLEFTDVFSDYSKSKIFKLHEKLNTQGTQGKLRKFPLASTIIFFQMLSKVYSTSDFQHPIITPATILISQYLSQCPLKTLKDMVVGIHLCLILFQYQSKSKRLLPEALNFLYRALSLLVSDSEEITKISGFFPFHDDDKKNFFKIKHNVDDKIEHFNLRKILWMNMSYNAEEEKSIKVSIFIEASNFVLRYSKLYSESLSYIELFEPMISIFNLAMNEVNCNFFNEETIVNLKLQKDLIKNIISTASLKRRPLQLQKRKPKAIATFVPKFSDNYSIDRKSNDPNKERNETQKLNRQYKKEFKGAQRELRKDGEFIAKRKFEEIKEKDAVYKKKIDGIMGNLANQEGAMRGYEKAKKKGKI